MITSRAIQCAASCLFQYATIRKHADAGGGHAGVCNQRSMQAPPHHLMAHKWRRVRLSSICFGHRAAQLHRPHRKQVAQDSLREPSHRALAGVAAGKSVLVGVSRGVMVLRSCGGGVYMAATREAPAGCMPSMHTLSTHLSGSCVGL